MRFSWQRIVWSSVLICWTILLCLGGWYADKRTVVVIALAAMNTILLAYIWYINALSRFHLPILPEDEEKKRMGTSLAIAEKIQKQLLPSAIPQMKGLDCFVRSRPSEEIGGDFYQIVEPDADHVVFAMGDVAGHGLPSGIISIMIDTLFYAFSQQSLSLVEMLTEMNNILYKRIDPSLFASMILFSWQRSTQELTMASAGFGYLLHWDSDTKQTNKVKGGGIALGMIENIRPYLDAKKVTFKEGDSLIVATDGISELVSKSGNRLGLNGLSAWTNQYAHAKSAQEIFESLSKEIADFVPISNQYDDITLMVLTRLPC